MNILMNLNWLAIAIATIAYSAFSGMWHRQFAFGKKWENAMDFQRPKDWKESGIYYVVPSIACFITSIAIAFIQGMAHIDTLEMAFKLGLVLGIGFGLAITFTNAVIPIMKKPLVFASITGTAHAIAITLVSVLIYLISHS